MNVLFEKISALLGDSYNDFRISFSDKSIKIKKKNYYLSFIELILIDEKNKKIALVSKKSLFSYFFFIGIGNKILNLKSDLQKILLENGFELINLVLMKNLF